MELFCQTIYQNGSRSTDRVAHRTETQKQLHEWSETVPNGAWIEEQHSMYCVAHGQRRSQQWG